MITEQNFHYIYRIGKRTRPFFQKKNSRFYQFYKKNDKKGDINNYIRDKIIEGKPLMITRFGSTESEFIVNNLHQTEISDDVRGIFKYLTGQIGLYWKYSDKYMSNLSKLSGFFPNDISLGPRFIQLYLDAAKEIDVLGVWNELEEYIPTIPEDVKYCNIRELEPWFFENPWSSALKNKKVLVIHPFDSTIRLQYEKRNNIYKNLNVLPKFELLTLKAIQSIADEEADFQNWFEALKHMKNQIDKIDFDIAIIGCGAYGLPLASYIKDKGKQAIHLGGVTQLLFGIKGKRWEDWEHYTSLRGNAWITASEKPKGYEKVENGCYW